MQQTSFVFHIPASKDVLLLVEIILTPRQFGGGGSLPETILLQVCPDF